MLLLDLLRQMADSLPGDNWILGQRVRYLLDDGQPDSAIAPHTTCVRVHSGAPRLAGYAFHLRRERYPSADSAYDLALSEMPAVDRCAWTDISSTLDGDLAKEYSALDCAAA